MNDTQQSSSNSKRQFNLQRLGWTLLVIFTAINIGYSAYLSKKAKLLNGDSKSIRLALSVGSQDPYWDALIAGAEKAAKEQGVELQVQRPADLKEQNVFLRKAHVQGGIDGVALSPVDVQQQADLINIMSASMDVVTIDSDAPGTRRDFYIGTNNYEAGRQLGRLVKEVTPEGGKVVISVGSLAKVNGQQRRQGLIDELLGRDQDRERALDPIDVALQGGEYTIVTYTDGTNAEQARLNAAKAVSDHPDAKVIVGLYGYSIPETIAGLVEAGAGGDIQLIGFDTAPATLDAIRSGKVYATLEQRTEQFGYDSIAALARMARGDNAPVLESRLHACRMITQTDLDAPAEEEATEAVATP